MEVFRYLPFVFFVAEEGLDHFEAAMSAQYELTKRFTAEFSIRAYLDRYPDRTLDRLAEWAADNNAHPEITTIRERRSGRSFGPGSPPKPSRMSDDPLSEKSLPASACAG